MQSYAPSRPAASTVYGSPAREDEDDVPLSPPDKSGKKKRRRFLPTDPNWAKTLLIAGAILMVVSGISGGVVVSGRVALNIATSGINQEDLLPDDVRVAGKTIDGPLNILLLGLDERSDSKDPIRTDSIMIAHIPASHDAVYLISLPRDTLVSIPAMSEFNFPGQSRAKLTEVYQVGNGAQGDDSAKGRRNGVTATSRVISQLVPGGLRFNATAIINYKGFKSLVTALDGVHMCIDEVVKSEHYDAQGKYHTSTSREGVSQYTYKKGCRDLKAWEALDYSRQRKGLPNGDYDRQRHQQQLMRAIVAKMMDKGTLTDVSKINQLRKAAGDLLTLDLGKVPMEDWIFSFKGLSEKDVVMIKTNGGTYSGGGMIDGVSYERLTPDSQKLLKAVHDDTVYDFLTQHSDWMANTK